MADTLQLEDVRFRGRHGMAKAEPDTWFSVDAELEVDLRAAALSDDLDAAVDYERVARRIVEIGGAARVNLLERLATLVADGLLREFPARAVRVRVRRLGLPLGGMAGTPAVVVSRSR